MKENSFKTIVIIILVFVIIVICNNMMNKKETNIIEDRKVNIEKENNVIADNIRIGIAEFDNINPILSNNKNVQDISRLIFEPLFSITQDYKLEQILVKDWTKLDNTTYLIKLRDDVKWQNDDKFDVSDVIFTIDILKNIGDKSVYFYNVRNILEVQKIDEYTLKIIIDTEIPFFEYNLIFPIVSSKYFSKDDFEFESKNIKPVGTGKYYISSVENDSILLKKNINKSDSIDMNIDNITLKLYKSFSGVINAYKSGEIDIFTTSNSNIEEFLNNINYNKIEYINRNYYYIALNCKSNVLSNIEVRQAINFAINKEDIMKDTFSTRYKVSNFPLDFGSYCYNINNEIIAYDFNISKRLLVDNEWKYSSKKWIKTVKNRYLKIDLKLVVNKSESNLVKVANKIKEQLESVGIRIEVVEANDKKYNEYLKNKNYDMIMMNCTYGYSPSLQKYFQDDNIANYKNEEINNIMIEVEKLNDDKELEQKYSRIVQIYNEEVPYISLFFNKNIMIYSNNLKGNISPNSYNLFYNIENWYREYKEKNNHK